MRFRHCFILFVVMVQAGFAGAVSYSLVDNAAKSLPVKSGQTPNAIVENLIKPNYTDMEKARVLAAFVAYQMQKNGYAYKEAIKASQQRYEAKQIANENVLKTRIGTSSDYALLYRDLCRLAGLQAVAIEGFAGMNVQKPRANAKLQALKRVLQQTGGVPDYGMQQYEAMWNAVKVDGKWILVDTFWMVGGEKGMYAAQNVNSDRQMESFLRKRETTAVSLNELTRGKTILDAYFNAPPRTFIKTHYSFDSEWQLLPNPVSFNSFIK